MRIGLSQNLRRLANLKSKGRLAIALIGIIVWAVYLLIWPLDVRCAINRYDPYEAYESASRAYVFSRLANSLKEQSKTVLGADIAEILLVREKKTLYPLSFDLQMTTSIPFYDTIQRSYYQQALGRGCASVPVGKLDGAWAQRYKSLGAESGILCVIRNGRDNSLKAVMAYGWASDPPPFEVAFELMYRYRDRLESLLLEQLPYFDRQ